MNDGGTDLGPTLNPTLVVTPPIAGAPLPTPSLVPDVLPLTGVTIYYDHFWSDSWSSSIGYSQTRVDNTNFQASNAFKKGEYASVNLLYTPDKRLLFGGELLWGHREDKNGAGGDDTRLQFSFKYSFSSADFR